MSISRTTVLLAMAAGWGQPATAEALWPDYLRRPADSVGLLRAGAGSWLMPGPADKERGFFLHDIAANGQGRPAEPMGSPGLSGRWAPGAAQPSSLQADEPGDLIEGLNAIGPIRVSVDDYLALAVTAKPSASGVALPALDASRARGIDGGLQTVMDYAPSVDKPSAPTAASERRRRWALPTLPATQAGYLVMAVALTIVAAAGLRLARLTRRKTTRLVHT